MRIPEHHRLALGAALALGLIVADVAYACDGAGIVKKIDGGASPAMVNRDGQPNRMHVLQVICRGDVIHAGDGPVLLSITGRGNVTVAAKGTFTVQVDAQQTTLANNAYKSLIGGHVGGEMSRIRAEVREKGGDDPFGFAVAGLDASGQQEVSTARSTLLIRLVGGEGPFNATLVDANGTAFQSKSYNHDLVFDGVSMAPGPATVRVKDQSGSEIAGVFKATKDQPILTTDYQTIDDAEVRIASQAIDLARDQPKVRALEAEQILNSAPVSGVDRNVVFTLIETY